MNTRDVNQMQQECTSPSVLSNSKDGVAKVCEFFFVHLETTNATNSQYGKFPSIC